MSRETFLAHGPMPPSYSGGDNEEGPCELPDGRLVCGPHGLVVCGKCCMDLNSIEDEDDNVNHDKEANEGHNDDNEIVYITDPNDDMRRGTGRVFPTKFSPPSPGMTPLQLFVGMQTYVNLSRYIRRNDPKQILMFIDGACLNNGKSNPRAGWGLIDGPGSTVSIQLENKGPWGDPGLQTSNRAELRAVIAALRLRRWTYEGWNSIVIATDSEHVVEGCTTYARTWTQNGWKTAAGTAVKNKNLWEALLGEVERWNDKALTVQFWRIPQKWNQDADAAAKKGAEGAELKEFMPVYGVVSKSAIRAVGWRGQGFS